MGNGGRIEAIVGCMFSGKTTELIRRLSDAVGQGLPVIACKPRADTRCASGRIVAHEGATFPARSVDDSRELVSLAANSAVIGIDEVHFFDETLIDTCNRLVTERRRVIAAGVDTDHRGHPFDTVRALLAVADDRLRLTARCARCGGVAEYSQRLVPSDERIVVGGAESYEPRCRFCFRPPA